MSHAIWPSSGILQDDASAALEQERSWPTVSGVCYGFPHRNRQATGIFAKTSS